MTVGERIKQVREEKQLSQEALAKKMGYAGKTSISKIESSGDNVTNRTVTKFAKALGVTEARLMGWEDDIESKAELAADIYFNDDNITSLIEIYKKLNDNRKDDLFVYANFLLSKQRED